MLDVSECSLPQQCRANLEILIFLVCEKQFLIQVYNVLIFRHVGILHSLCFQAKLSQEQSSFGRSLEFSINLNE